LKYLEIGNENSGPLYDQRYQQFYDAIKKRYPQIELIASTWNGVPRPQSRPLEIVDEHYYSTQEFFRQNATRYDGYDRHGPRVFVGEYAVTQNCGNGNLLAALGEAAFMTGLERNGDIVAMASYAPLFCNSSFDDNWEPDAIYFDNAKAFGTPSYYVQEMFGANRVDVVLPATLSEPVPQPEPITGMVGVGTWNTEAEFKDIKVSKNGHTLFESNFANGLQGWKYFDGQWEVRDGALRQSDDDEDERALAGEKSWSDYTYTLRARKLSGSEGFLIIVGRQGDEKCWWNLGGWDNTADAIELPGIPALHVAAHIETGRWYDIRVELNGPSISCYLDEKLVQQATRGVIESLFAVAGRKNNELVLKVVNTGEQKRTVLINLRGIENVEPTGEIITLSSASSFDENWFFRFYNG
jgi:alpha-L-arabinofuranosidase